MGMISTLSIHLFLFISMFFFAPEAFSQERCGNTVCASGQICQKERVLGQYEYSCVASITPTPQPPSRSQPRQSGRGSADQCSQQQGPCPDGQPKRMINGQCACGQAPAQQQQGASCKQQYQTLAAKCDSTYEETTYSCDEKKRCRNAKKFLRTRIWVRNFYLQVNRCCRL